MIACSGPAQDTGDSIPAWGGAVTTKSTNWGIIGNWSGCGRLRFLLGLRTWKTTHAPVDRAKHKDMQTTLTGLQWVWRKPQWRWEEKVVGGVGGVLGHRMERWTRSKHIHAHRKFSNNKKQRRKNTLAFKLKQQKRWRAVSRCGACFRFLFLDLPIWGSGCSRWGLSWRPLEMSTVYPRVQADATAEAEESRCILNIRLVKPAEGAGVAGFLIYGSGRLPVTVTKG